MTKSQGGEQAVRPDTVYKTGFSAMLDEYVVMPNHLHGLIVITDETRCDSVGASVQFAPTEPRAPLPGSLGAILMQWKSIVTKRINAVRDTRGTPVWQRNHHGHVIRDEDDLNRIREDICENPERRGTDDENPMKSRGAR